MTLNVMEPVFFSNQMEFRKWLEQNHDKETELMVGFYKVSSGKQNMTWSQSVDQALCYGWIDGIRRSIDSERYCIRFTPRRPGSKWSAVNIDKVERLKKKGLMHPSGTIKFKNIKKEHLSNYSYENKAPELTEDLKHHFKANQRAWDFFNAQAPSYQKIITRWVMDAKQEKTRYRRLDKVISHSEAAKRIF